MIAKLGAGDGISQRPPRGFSGWKAPRLLLQHFLDFQAKVWLFRMNQGWLKPPLDTWEKRGGRLPLFLKWGESRHLGASGCLSSVQPWIPKRALWRGLRLGRRLARDHSSPSTPHCPQPKPKGWSAVQFSRVSIRPATLRRQSLCRASPRRRTGLPGTFALSAASFLESRP